MERLAAVSKPDDIFPEYLETPIGKLLKYHNLNHPYDTYDRAQLLIGMCMDNRKNLRTPDNFAFIIRTGGANLRYNEFKVSYAIAVGQVEHIALIGHNNCGMANVFSRKDLFVEGLVNRAGCNKEWAEEQFMQYAPMFEIGDEVDFILNEAKRIRLRYPKIQIAPLMYILDDNKLYLIKE